ncbi:GPI-GlcNAc transferase complex, PIG-H component-domain-containing protein [Chlamydoabsidia padenii]|nr:GPI-GlcNAc transferase complex, PIG-H component-domain-containing protein [Chlamydoabsidia padenii]
MSLCQEEHDEKTYTDTFTSRILPGGHTHEYTVISNRPNLTPLDMIVLLIISIAIWMNKTTLWVWMLPLGWLWIKLRNVKQESLLVMQDIGIQVKTTYWSGRSESKFINRQKIENVVINEGITLWQVKPYMAILVKEQDKMTIVFENLLPSLHPALLDTYKGTKQLLFSESTTSSSDSSSVSTPN